MKHLISALFLFGVKIISRLFFRFDIGWVGQDDPKRWENVSIIALINHTSLYEPLFIGAVPFSFIWNVSKRIVLPGADKTLKRPLVGTFYKLLAPRIVSITRKRDNTWDEFMSQVQQDDVVIIAPEGRMLRPTGLDSEGKPMNIKGGIAEIIDKLSSGKLLLVYSGGLHHIQIPGQHFPKLFKTIRVNFEVLDIPTYKAQMKSLPLPFKKAVVDDLEARKKKHCPISSN